VANGQDSLQFLLVFLASIILLMLDSHLRHPIIVTKGQAGEACEPSTTAALLDMFLHAVSFFNVQKLFLPFYICVNANVSSQCPEDSTSHSDCHDFVNFSNCAHVNRTFLCPHFLY